MTDLIDDATADLYLTEIDKVTGDDRLKMANALEKYADNLAEKRSQQTDEHFSKLFTDEAYFEQEKQANAAVQEAPDPDQAAKRTLIGAWLEHRVGRPIDTMSYQVERDAYAMANYGKKNLDDNQLFDFISGEYNTQKKKTEAINDLQMQVAAKALSDSHLDSNRPFFDGITNEFNAWKSKYPELVDGKNDAAFLSQGYKLYYDVFNDIESVRGKASNALSTLTSFTQGNATDEDMQSLANDFVSAPPEDRQKIYKYVTLAAQAGQIDRAGIEQFAVNMGQAFTRGFDFVPQGTLQMQEAGVNNWLESIRNGTQIWVPTDGDLTKAVVGNAPAGAESDAWRQATLPEAETLIQSGQNVRESFKVVRELRNVAKTGVDPIRPVLEEDSFWGTAERGAYGLAGSIPLMGATAVNPYLGVLAYQATEYDRIMLENPDINPQFAQGLALVEGAANAAIDRVQLSSLSGKLPMFGRYLDRIKSDGIRRTVKIGANVVEQNLQEGAQDLIAPVLETAVASLREDMPDKDFTSLMDEWAGQRAETFFATLPLALIGGGIATYQDIKNPSAELNATRLRQVGFDKEQVTFIQRAENPEEYDARIQMEWDKRTPENIEAGRQEVIAEMQQAATPDENSAKLSETVAEDGTRRWVVTTPDGKELLQTQDQQAALIAIREHNGAQLLNDQFKALYEPEELRKMISDLSTQWTSEKPANTLVMESEGMNAQQELEQLQAAGNAAQIQELHNRIANSPMKDTPYEQINILGKASVDDVAEMVFGSLITINPNTRPENLREEIHHIGVKVAIKNGSVTLDTLRGWLDATEKALPGTFQNLVRDTEGDIVESLAQVQAAYENGKINADEETKLPASFIGYIKNMMRTFAEVMRRAVALRGAFKDGALPAEYETFLADSVGLNQQARVDTASSRVSKDIITDGGQMLMDFSIGSRTSAVSTDTPSIRATNATITGPANYSIGAFHGTPHKVDKFSTEKIGTGEGAQAYGWGLYFAENKKVAEQYRKGLTEKDFIRKVRDVFSEFDGVNEQEGALTELPLSDGQRKLLDVLKREDWWGFDYPHQAVQAALREPENFDTSPDLYEALKTFGNFYTVDLDVEPEDLLDWDKPFSEQSPKVQAALKAVQSDNPLWKDTISGKNGKPVGGAIYKTLTATWPDSEFARDGIDPKKKASEALLAAGIPGIRYLDGGSRSEGQGTYNYVAFDENLIKITEENGNRIAAADALTSGQTNYSIGSMPEDQRAAEQSGQPSRGGSDAEVLKTVLQSIPMQGSGQYSLAIVDGLQGSPFAFRHGDGFVAVVDVSSERMSQSRSQAQRFRLFQQVIGKETLPPNTFIRVTNSKDDYQHIKNGTHRGSQNHGLNDFDTETNPDEGGLSVAYDFEFPAKYAYLVSGEIAKTGTDGEPILAMDSVKVAGPLMQFEELAEKIKIPSSSVTETNRFYFSNSGKSIPYRFGTVNSQSDLQPIPFNSPAPSTGATNYSIGKKQDADYLAAVDRGDMETVQKMVDEAAKNAGYDVKGWHGTNADFDVFKPSKYGANGPGIYFSNDKDLASFGKRTISAWIKNPIFAGYEIIAKSPEQVKSAEPVTRDDAGNVIPLSQRFNPRSADINYSIGFAPNGKPSNLKPEDQALARSPEFKARAGDWEVLAEDAAWKKTVEDYYSNPNQREPLKIGRVPSVLRAVGVSDAPMVMPPSVIHKVTVKKHTLTREMVEQIPSALRDPIFVFNSATEPNSVTILTDIRHQGKNVVAAIHLDRPAPRKPANLVVSLHDRPASQIENWIKDGLILYANQGKARAYFRSARLQLPREGSKAGNQKLLTEADVVNRSVNPESIPVKTDENGEPLASEIARFRQETGTSSYSIASQSEIDRVNRALGGMNRGPDERLKVYQRAKQKFSKLMAWNSDELAAMADTGSDDSQIRRTQILQALGELDGILSVLPPEVRGRVGGYTKLAGIAPMDVLKDGVKVSEVSGMNGAIISAWMREGQNIGQAGKQVSLPPGYTATENLSTKRADKAIADFFRDRIKRIDTELEKVLVREYTESITKAVKQSRPKAGDNGVRKSTLGAETQKFADMVQRATLLDDEATPKRMAEIEAALTNPDATAEDVSALSEEWSILNTFGDLDNRSSETLAQGLDWLKGELQMGREAWRIKEQARIDEQRARARQTIEWLGKGTAKKRNATKTKSELASDLANHYLLSHANFEQFVTAIFPPEIASRWAEKLRKADEASQTAEIRDRKGILDAVRAGAKAANMSTADALLWLKADQKNAVAYLEDRKVTDERIAIDLAQKIVTGEADRSKLTDADVETLRNELAALPADTQKEYVTIKRVIFRGNDVKLDMSRGKAMQYLLSWNQPDVQIKMRKEGWTDESAADLQALVNDPVSREVMAYAKELYGKGAGIVNPVYSRMFGMNMPQVKNYAPTRFLNAKDSKDIGLDGSATATGTTPGFAKSRVTHSAKIAPEDALTVMQGHIAQQAHWVHFAELAREFRAILSNPEVRESIKQTQGESVLKDAELWADQMEQRGGNKARESTWMNTILGTVLSGKAISSLGFNLKTLAMQLENTIRFGLALDMKQIVSALSNPAAIVEDIQTVWESNAIQNRLQGGATAEARFLFSRYAGKPNFAAKIAEASMTPINWLDSAGTSISSAIVYRANLNDALAAGMPENLAKQAALNAASEAIYRFAQPVSFGQKSIMENNGNVLAKTFFLFMSDPRLKTAILADAARGLATGRGDASEHIRRIVTVELMAVLSHVISSAFRDAFSDDDDEEIWNLGGFAKAILLAPLQGFFFAGTVGELAISKLTGQKFFSSTQNPLVTSMEQAIRAGTNMEDAINFDDPEAMLKEWNNIFRSMAVTPTMAAPAVLLNMVKPVVGLYQNATTED